MLKRLELIGFKSFADRTRFDFAPGITAIVGPNGSGKSNVVDAVKWVLGEQSAKSLRGGEMIDVIFNGSSTRKSLGLAEVLLTFQNQKRILNCDADEVQIGRRVYRDGQSEYLLNGQIARLKDIKDLFLGTGAGHGAYSVIEQGRVDALLTASTRDRRIIFEEAAGISRFKAKKLETLRKLERVDTDLTRVRDIFSELDKQLRGLRLQAVKTSKHREQSAELRRLRIGLATREFRELGETLRIESQVLTGYRAAVADAIRDSTARESRVQELEADWNRADDELRREEAGAAAARQRIVNEATAAKFERDQETELEGDSLRLGRDRIEHRRGQSEFGALGAALSAELAECEQRSAVDRREADRADAVLAAVQARIQRLQTEIQENRRGQFEWIARAAHSKSEADRFRGEVERFRRELDRKRAEAERAAQQCRALGAMLDDLSRTDADVKQKLGGAEWKHAEQTCLHDELRTRAESVRDELEALRERRGALRGRLDVLEFQERNREGFGAGVRVVLDRIIAADAALAGVVGLIADLLVVSPEAAPFVDLVLADAAQRFVVRNAADLDSLAAALPTLPGRVGFVPFGSMDCKPHPLSLARFVSCEAAGLESLPHQLLGGALLVEDLATARSVAAANRGFRVLTRIGELLEPDGSLSIGPANSGGGLLSRKSELKELRQSLVELDARIAETDAEQQELGGRIDGHEATLRALETELHALRGEAGSLRERIREQRGVQEQLAELGELLKVESAQLDRERADAATEFERSSAAWAGAEQMAETIRQSIETGERELGERRTEAEARQVERVAGQVAVGRSTEQAAALRSRHREWERERVQRDRRARELDQLDSAVIGKLAACRRALLVGSQRAAYAHGEKESAELSIRKLLDLRIGIASRRDALRRELKAVREAWSTERERAHAHQMLVQDLTFRRNTLAARIREDYGVELAEAVPPNDGNPTPLAWANPDEVQEQIDELKRKITKLGSVNPDAIEELAELEKRAGDLRGQHDDLADSHRKLREIIAQIDGDSRKLFADTLAVVRVHFQELFRKLFGGGQADIVLEDETNPLESGIEVVVHPPGKELRSLSLLSGGERTLTAIALLLAIFRSRPSPFCLLDEVDAALDEANTARLAAALGEFLEQSQFIVITHKKRTMAAADVLYGITMQESGVSKQVAVRFEDYADERPAKIAA